jgi:hypothetical protein
MSLDKIISISGKPGLFKAISKTNYGLIAESLENGKRIPVYSTSKVSSLDDISIYTNDEDVPLKEVFKKILEITNSAECNPTDPRGFFAQILPDFDQERVYNSDIKKIYMWYNLLLKNNLLNFSEEVTENIQNKVEESSEAKKPAAKAAANPAKQKNVAPKNTPKADSRSKGAAKINTPRKAQ